LVVLVSACLLGVKCRYDGGRRQIPDKIQDLIKEGKSLVPVCPEQLGGLPTPRAKSQVIWNNDQFRVINDQGVDVTLQFVAGAQETLRIAQIVGAERACLKSKSPSCGSHGVTRRLLAENGIQVTIIDSPSF
jgi:uncharacterized protein YbbK (DUF523 family)